MSYIKKKYDGKHFDSRIVSDVSSDSYDISSDSSDMNSDTNLELNVDNTDDIDNINDTDVNTTFNPSLSPYNS